MSESDDPPGPVCSTCNHSIYNTVFELKWIKLLCLINHCFLVIRSYIHTLCVGTLLCLQVKQAKCTSLSLDLEFGHLTGHTYRRDRRKSVKFKSASCQECHLEARQLQNI